MRRTLPRRARTLATLLLAFALHAASDGVHAQGDANAAAERAARGPGLLPPSDTGLRDDLAWLVDRRVLSLPLATWPIPASLLRSALATAAQRGDLSPIDADALARVRRALQRALAGGSVGARLNTARHPSLDGTAPVRGKADASASVRQHGEQWSARLQVNALADPLNDADRKLSLAGSYLAFEGGGLMVTLGEVDRWWGPGQFASPILSSAAEPFPALLLRRSRDDAPGWDWLRWIGPWGYEFSLGQLRDYRPARTRMIGMRVYARPFRALEIGLSRHIQWAGEGRPKGFSALSDALLARSNVEDAERESDPSNELAGIDLRLSGLASGGWAWVTHAQVIGEDEAGNSPSRVIATLGAQVKHPLGQGRIEWSAEGTDTRLGRVFGLRSPDVDAPAYIHGAYLDGYYHQGLPIGANIGGGGRIYALGAAWVPACGSSCERWRLTLFEARVSELGAQPINAVYGAPGSVRGGSLGLSSQSAGLNWNVGISVQRYSAGPRPSVGLQAGIEVPLQRGD